METLTIIQLMEAAIAYLFMTLFLPALVLRPVFRQKSFAVRFMVYQMAGNFFMMNLVFALELLHISYRVTLILFSIVICVTLFIKLWKRHPISDIKRLLALVERLAAGQMGMRLFLRKLRDALWQGEKKILHYLWRELSTHFLDMILLCGLFIALWHSYGVNLILNFGYAASDIPVHNYWINYLGKNKIFVAGIYPFGMHCVIYYIRLVFGIPTYVMLRVFCFVQTVMIHLVLFAFIRCCCKSRYLPYAGLFVYTLASFFGSNTYGRYLSTLPQEFAMLFLLPSIYFLFAFLDRKEEDEISEKWYLALFTISFSMTLAVHFYDTMIAGLLCIGVVVGYFFRIFRKKYFWKIMVAGILSIFIAVFPMLIAFAMGTPLQGSLGWAMNVISSSNRSNEDLESEEEQLEDEELESEEEQLEDEELESEEEQLEDEDLESEEGQKTNPTTSGNRGRKSTDGDSAIQKESRPSFQERAHAYLKRSWEGLMREIATWYIQEAPADEVTPGAYYPFQMAVPISAAILFGFAILFFVIRQVDYAAKLLTVSAGTALLLVLLNASSMGLPSLMEAKRAAIFNAYFIPVTWTLCADAVLFLILGWIKREKILNSVSLLVSFAVTVFLFQADLIRPMPDTDTLKVNKYLPGFMTLQTNEAITCLTNIIHDNENFTWTIVSANDELRMAEDYGLHYEIDTFLKQMENSGPYGEVFIPTKKVYFFIEKVPQDYTTSPYPYAGSGQTISRWGARHALPYTGGITVYQIENRWIEMSRMFYWAQTFREAYPHEFSVYYETDQFVCYCVEQNLYSLINFSLDYGYNMNDVE